MERKFRLTRASDFQRVRQNGKSYAHPLFVLVVLQGSVGNGMERSTRMARCGVAAGRKLGNAVQRNRAKRLLRSAIHPWLPGLLPGRDLILIARRPILEASFSEIQEALRTVLWRAKLVQETHDVGIV